MKLYIDDAFVEALKNGAQQLRQAAYEAEALLEDNPQPLRTTEIVESQLASYRRQAVLLEDVVQQYNARKG